MFQNSLRPSLLGTHVAVLALAEVTSLMRCKKLKRPQQLTTSPKRP